MLFLLFQVDWVLPVGVFFWVRYLLISILNFYNSCSMQSINSSINLNLYSVGWSLFFQTFFSLQIFFSLFVFITWYLNHYDSPHLLPKFNDILLLKYSTYSKNCCGRRSLRHTLCSSHWRKHHPSRHPVLTNIISTGLMG